MKAEIKRELDRLKARAPEGKLTIATVIDAARDRHSVLHDAFTWDARDALKANLENEARALLREYQIVIITPSGPISTRHFVSLSSDRQTGGGYRYVQDVLSDEAMSVQLLQDALAELAAFQQRYNRLEQLAGIFKELSALQEKFPPKKSTRKTPKSKGGEGRAAA